MRKIAAQFRILVTLGFGLWLMATPILGQRRPPAKFFDPDKFFNEMFGEETAADRAALQKVKISARDESRFGNSAAKQYLTQLKGRGVEVTERGSDAAYVRCLVNMLRTRMKNHKRYSKIRIYVADSLETDAISFPGGTIVIFRGLIEFCENEAALVGVLGHELSHIDRGHQLYYMRRWKIAQQSFQGGGFDPKKMMNLGGMMAKTFSRPFRPEEETEADLDGARWAFELAYDPKELAEVFLRMHNRDQSKRNLASARSVASSFFRSHPFHIDRYEAILGKSNELVKKNPTQPLYIGRPNVQKRTCRARKKFD